LTGPGIEPEKTDTDASPFDNVVAVTGTVAPTAPRPTPPGFVTILNFTGTLGSAIPPEDNTLNFTIA
jgi:hypothetical protein